MMLVCGKNFSQTDTRNKVVIDTIIAKKIGIDLVKGDQCKEENVILRNNISLLNEKVSFKDNIINDKNMFIGNQTKIIESKDELITIGKENLSTAKREIGVYKKQATLWKIITSGSLLLSFIVLVK
jgi:phage antirepressor YoqD-like protein